jgi:hypothetical protein
MIAPPQHRVPHLRGSFIVANVGIGSLVEAPTNLPPAATPKLKVDT